MDIKVLISILNKPWFIEPTQAQHWAGIAESILIHGTMPTIDKRKNNTATSWTGEMLDTGPVFRIDENGKVDKNGAIQVFHIDAPIAKYDYCGAPGSQTWSQLLNAAYEDNSIMAVLLWADTPGGQVDGTELFADTIRARNKPVVTYADGMLCSAGYWIGSSADEIVCNAANDGYNATIGSIGTMASLKDYRGKNEKDGIKEHLVFADKSSDKWGDYFSVINGDYTGLKKTLNGLNETFLSAVMANREGKLKLDQENVLTGKVYNANEALKWGLVDMLGGFDKAVERASILGRKHKQQQKATMNKNTAAFQGTLTAAKADEFKVVDGGFLVTEDNLNNIEAALDQTQAEKGALVQQNKKLTADLAAATTSGEALAEAQKKVTDAEAAKTDAESKLEAANKQISELEAKIKSFGEGGASFFGASKGSEGNDPAQGSDEDTDKALAELPHYKKAAQI